MVGRGDQAALDAVSSPAVSSAPSGEGTVETYTVKYDRSGVTGVTGVTGVIGGRVEDGSRFLATTRSGDKETLDRLLGEEPFGMRVHLSTEGVHTYAAAETQRAD